jgi:hypothetical protein
MTRASGFFACDTALRQIEMMPRWIPLTTAVMRLLTPSFLIVFEI